MNVLSMHALMGAYRPEGYEWLDELTQVLGANVDWACDYIAERFDGVSVQKPQGTYMLFVDCSEWCAANGRDIDWVERVLARGRCGAGWPHVPRTLPPAHEPGAAA